MAKEEALQYLGSLYAQMAWPALIAEDPERKDPNGTLDKMIHGVDKFKASINYDHLIKLMADPPYVPASEDTLKYMAAHLENGTLDVDDIETELDRLRLLQ